MKNLTPVEIFTLLTESYPKPVELAVSDDELDRYHIARVTGYNPPTPFPVYCGSSYCFAALPTRRMWFKYGLPTDIYKRAIELTPEESLNEQVKKCDALPLAFTWSSTKEWAVFWNDVNNAFMDGKPHVAFPKLPPLPEIDWKKVPVDTPILCWNTNPKEKVKCHYAGYPKRAFSNGTTSWSSGQIMIQAPEWQHMELAPHVEVKKEWFQK